MNGKQNGNDYIVSIDGYSLRDSLDCGQSFRWEETSSGRFHGVAGKHALNVRQEGGQIIFEHTSEKEFQEFWCRYFDFAADYSAFKRILCLDPVLQKACEYAGGIRILRQEPWEALCSFIISQNNNIPRIKGIIARLCQNFGEPLNSVDFTFPEPEAIARCTVADLQPLRAGFRAKYILDAAKKVSTGEVDLDAIAKMETEEARKELMKIQGVGPKVAECALLFGFYRVEAFPVDVWVKRILELFYQKGVPDFAKPYGGIAQQYLFHYVRCHPESRAGSST